MTVINPAAPAQNGLWSPVGIAEYAVMVGTPSTGFVEVDRIQISDPSIVDTADPILNVSLTSAGDPDTLDDDIAVDLTQAALNLSNDRVDLDHTILNGATSLTTTFWLKTTKTGTQALISAANELRDEEFGVFLLNDTTVSVAGHDEQVTWTVTSLADGVFHHIAVVRNVESNSAELFIDGVSQGTRTFTVAQAPLVIATGGLVLGQDQDVVGGGYNADQAFVGQLDELTVWNRALTEADVAAIRNGQVNATSPDLALWLPFNEGNGSTARDHSRHGRDGLIVPTSYLDTIKVQAPLVHYSFNELTGSVATDDSGTPENGTYSGPVGLGVPGATSDLGTAAQFVNNSSNTSVIVPALGTHTNVTIEAWINPSSFAGFDSLYMADSAFGGTIHTQFVGGLRVSPLGAGDFDFGTAADFPLNQWTHVVAVLNGSNDTITVYANGRSLGTQSSAITSLNLTSARVGAWFDFNSEINRRFDGRIDEFALYNVALNADQVRQHYQSGLTSWTGSVPGVFNGTYQFPDEGDYTLRISVADKDGGTDYAETSFTVNNVAPVINDLNAPAGPYLIGQSITVDARDVVDPGINDTVTYHWQVISNNGETFTPSDDLEYSFTPQFAGVFEVTLTATDNDGASSSRTEIFNVNPIAVIGGELFDGTQRQTIAGGVQNPVFSTSTPILNTATVNAAGIIADVNVTIFLLHTFNADVQAFLVSPDGTRVELFTGVGGSSDNFLDVVLDDQAVTAITSGTGPFFGTFRPEGSLALFNGRSAQGTWTLELSDTFPAGDDGELLSWSLDITTAAELPEVGSVVILDGFDSSALAPQGPLVGTPYAVRREYVWTSNPDALAIVNQPVNYRAEVLAQTPVAYYRLNEAAGTTAVNEFGSAPAGTYEGGVVLGTAGAPITNGTAATFDGVDDRVVVTGYKGVTGANDRSVSLWFKGTTQTATSPTLVSWGSGSSGARWDIRLSGGALRVEVGGGGVTGTRNLLDNEWHHVLVTFANDGTPNVDDVLMYVDGVLETRSATTAQFINTGANNDVQIGNGFLDATRRFAGEIDEVAIFDRSLTAADARGLFEGSGRIDSQVGFIPLTTGLHTVTLTVTDIFTEAGVSGETRLSNSTQFTFLATAGEVLSIAQETLEAPAIGNGDFEGPVLDENQFLYFFSLNATQRSEFGWTQSGTGNGPALTRNLSGFQSGNIPAPEGSQHVALQTLSGETTGMTQTVTGFEIGQPYAISLLTMARQRTPVGNDLEIVLDLGLPTEQKILENDLVSFAEFTRVTSNSFIALKDSYTVTIRSTANGGTLTGDRTTMIDDVRLVKLPAEGDVITLTPDNLANLPEFNGQPFGVRSYLWQVAASNGQVIANATTEEFSFVPSDEGTYTVTLTVTDDFGSVARPQVAQQIITVLNAAPQLTVETTGTLSASGGAAIYGSLLDPGAADTFTFSINWGDGVTDTGAVTAGAVATGQMGSFSGTHSYATQGNKTVIVTVTDVDGGSHSQTITLRDVTAPQADIVDVVVDPRNTHAGTVTVNFTEAVTGVDINDFTLTRNGVAVSLTGLSVTAVSGSQYTIDLSSVTALEGGYDLLLRAAGTGIVDAAGNALAAAALDSWFNDTTAPTATLTDFGTTPLDAGTGVVVVQFSEGVRNFDLSDFSLTRNGQSISLASAILTPTDVGPNPTTWFLDLFQVANLNGVYQLTLTGTGITDEAGNALGTVVSTWSVEEIAPTAAVLFDGPANRQSAIGTVFIEFSEPVTGVGSTDLTLTRDGVPIDLLPLALIEDSPTLYSIDLTTVSDLEGDYVLTLNASGSGIQDRVANLLASDAVGTWTVDRTAPTADIADVDPDPRSDFVGEVLITFDEPVTGFDLNSLSLTRDGVQIDLTGVPLTQLSPTTWSIDLTTVTFFSQALVDENDEPVLFEDEPLVLEFALEGTYVLTLDPLRTPGTVITDAAGNLLTGAVLDEWTIDLSGPTAGFSGTPAAAVNSAVGTVTVTFDEPVTGVDITDFTLLRDGDAVSLSGVTVTTVSASEYTLNLSSVTAAGGEYELRLVAAGSNIADAVGNAFDADATVSFTVDTIAPVATIEDVLPTPRSSAVGFVTISFDEPVTGLDISDFTLTQNGQPVDISLMSLTPDSDSVYILDLLPVTNDNGTYVLTLNASGSGVTDLPGNALAGNAVATWVTDVDAPSAVFSAVNPNPRSTAVGTVTLSFDEPVTGVDISDLMLLRDGSPVSLSGLTLTTVSSQQYTLNLASVTTQPGEYRLTINAAVSDIVDAGGSGLLEDVSLPFTIDQTAPTVEIFGILPTPRTTPVGQVTLTFSEPVTGLTLSDFTLTRNGSNVALTGVTLTPVSSSEYVLDLSAVSGPDGSYVLTLASGSVSDAAGNALASAAAQAFAQDTTAPTATIDAVTPDPRTTAVGVVTVRLSEPVNGLDIDDFVLTRDGEFIGLLDASLVEFSATEYRLDLTGLTDLDGDYVLTLNADAAGIHDDAGNLMLASVSEQWRKDSLAPTADIIDITPDPRLTAVGVVTVQFNEAVTGVDIADFTLTRNGQTVSLSGLSVTAVSQTEYTLDLSTVTTAAGQYVLSLNSAGSGIADLTGNPLSTDATDEFGRLPAPTGIASGGPYLIDAGEDLVVTASVTGTSEAFVYAWDVNNDGTADFVTDNAMDTIPWLVLAVSGLGTGNQTLSLGVFFNGELVGQSSSLLTISDQFVFDFPEEGGDLRIRASSGRIEVRDNVTGALLSQARLAGINTAVITGSPSADRLLIDLSNAAVLPPLGMTFNGLGQASGEADTLTLTGTAGNVGHLFGAAGAGTLTIDGRTLNYTGIEPIVDTIVAVTRSFTFGSDADEVLLNDDGVTANGLSRIATSSSTTTVTFAGPTGSLTINAGEGDDSLVLNAVDSLFSAGLTINGQEGADLINGTALTVPTTLLGGDGNDVLQGGMAGDLLIGGSGDDSLQGGRSGDTLSGGAGNDLLVGGNGADMIVEEADIDFEVTDLQMIGLGTNRISSIERVHLIGGASGNVLNAQFFTGRTTLVGGGGADVLIGGAADDSLSGGDGDDTLTGGAGQDTISGGAGQNRLVESGNVNFVLTDVSLTGLGTDELSAMQEAFLTGGDGNNLIDASAFTGNVTISGGAGNDTLMAGSGTQDVLLEVANVNFILTPTTLTGLGTDAISGFERADLSGGDGNNTLDATAFNGPVTLRGGAGNDLLLGSGFDDVLLGESGSDTLTGGFGNDSLDGGVGDVDELREAGDVNMIFTATTMTGLGTDTLAGFERGDLTGGAGDNILDARLFGVPVIIHGLGGNDSLRGGGGSDTLIGGDGQDTLRGDSGIDSLDGGAGDDMLFGEGASFDSLRGGPGNDTLDGGGGNDIVMEDITTLSILTPTSMTGNGTDTLISIERGRIRGSGGADRIDASGFLTSSPAVTLEGSSGNDTLIGTTGGDRLDGGTGQDSLVGGAGNDLLIGGRGNDTLSGGAGNDTFQGEGSDTLEGIDTIVETFDADVFITRTTILVTTSAGTETDTMTGIDRVSITGGASANRMDASTFVPASVTVTAAITLIGGAGDDTLTGGAFADSLLGEDGNDVLTGLNGNDTLRGGNGMDILRGGAGNDLLDGGADNDGLSGGTGNDSIIGGSGRDTLYGGSGNDTLQGDAGEDILTGGSGQDSLDGGADSDTLVGGTGNGSSNPGDVFTEPGEIDEFFVLNPIPTWFDSLNDDNPLEGTD